MKTIFKSFFLFSLLFVISCNRDETQPINSTNNTVVKPTCLPKSSIIKRSDGSITEELTYEYNNGGQLKGWKIVRPGSPDVTGTYTYDTQGFCKEYTRIEFDGRILRYTYTYADAHLTKIEIQITDKNGVKTNFTETLEYDLQGKLLRAVNVSNNGTSTTSYDANGNVSDYVTKNSNGVESRLYQFENGRLKVATGFTLDYDNQGRVISRTTKNSSGVIVYKETYEYDTTGKNAFPDPEELTNRVFPLKGWPVRVIQFMNYRRLHMALITRITGTIYKNGVVDYMDREELFAYTLHASKQIPTQNRITVRIGTPNNYFATNTEAIYTYENCN